MCLHCVEEPELAFEYGARPLKAVGGQAGGQHTRLRGPPEVQALDHAAASEFEQAATGLSRELAQAPCSRAWRAQSIGHSVSRFARSEGRVHEASKP
jgi:hypothetical protein